MVVIADDSCGVVAMGPLPIKLAGLQERIAGCEAQLQQLDEQVVGLKGEFESKKGLEIELKSSLNKAEATLTAASSLLGKLSGEKSRWEAQVKAVSLNAHILDAAYFRYCLGA